MDNTTCPQCKGTNVYSVDELLICPDCFYEWSAAEQTAITEAGTTVIKDANGTILHDGDTVVTIKNLPVKGTSQSIKAGTKVKKIKLTDGDHNIDCRIDGFGAMALKSEFVKKVQE